MTSTTSGTQASSRGSARAISHAASRDFASREAMAMHTEKKPLGTRRKICRWRRTNFRIDRW